MLDDQVTTVFSGFVVAVNFISVPVTNAIDSTSNSMVSVTVTSQVAVAPPAVVAVMIALPPATPETAVTTPSWSTVAILSLLDDHVTVSSFALMLAIVKVSVSPATNIVEVFSNSIASSTVTVQVAAALPTPFSPPAVVAVMVAVPFPTAVTSPVCASTVATSASLVDHVTVVSDGTFFVASNVVISFTLSSSAVLFNSICSTTVTVQVAVTSSVVSLSTVAVIVTVPAFFAVTTPFSTVAISSLLDVQITVLDAGVVVAVKIKLSSTTNSFLSASSLISVAGISDFFVTVTVHVSVALPTPFLPAVVAVIVVSPSAIAVMLPFSSTVATFLSLDSQVTVMSFGCVVTANFAVVPSSNENVSGNVIVSETVTVHVSFTVSLSEIYAVIVAVPAPTAVTLPPTTVATLSSLDIHVTSLFAGFVVAVNVTVSPAFKSSESGFSNLIVSFIVTVQVAVFPVGVVAVIVAVPAPTAVTLPLSTVATDVSLDDQVSVIPLGTNVVASSCSVLPTSNSRVD